MELLFHQSLYCQCYVTFHRHIHPCNHNLLFCLCPDQQVHIPYRPPFSLGSRHPHLELNKLHMFHLITCKLQFKHVAQTLIFEKNAAFSQSIHISKTFYQNYSASMWLQRFVLNPWSLPWLAKKVSTVPGVIYLKMASVAVGISCTGPLGGKQGNRGRVFVSITISSLLLAYVTCMFKLCVGKKRSFFLFSFFLFRVQKPMLCSSFGIASHCCNTGKIKKGRATLDER